MISHNSNEQEIRQQAADWAVRLDAQNADATELQHWLAQDPAHGVALDYARATWGLLAELGREAATANTPIALPVRKRAPLTRWVGGAAASVLLLLGLQQAAPLLTPMLADEATGRGEIRRITLPDGSVATLDANSAIDLHYSATERRIELLSGDASFTVAPVGGNEPRPFIVDSAGGSSRALGTQFVVSQDAKGAWMGVLEHSVELTLQQPGSGLNRQVLQEGQAAHYTASGGIEMLPGFDVARASSWQRGVLVFDRVPLAQVAERLNRYRPGWLMITDKNLAQREVSGVFRLDSLDDALTSVTTELHASRVDFPGVTLLY
ncbi:MAG: FecR domain-containing protein [Pseudomonas sp.]